ncbi:MAG: amidohydrolase family protein [Rhodospirillales bacterium]
MEPAVAGAIDCDVHPAVPSVRSLLPHLDPCWRDAFVVRGQDGFDAADHPFGSPLACRPDFRPERGPPGSDPERLIRQAVEEPGVRFAVLNCLYGGQLALSEPMATALCRAVNDWIAAEWLARDPRLRASILVPPQDPEAAAAEIDRLAADRRFVQVLLPLTTELMLGKRFHWPLYAAAERHGLPVGFHAGGPAAVPPSAGGWPSHSVEYLQVVGQTGPALLASLVLEGVFDRFPRLKVVVVECGFAWVPAFAWRLDGHHERLGGEVPDLKRRPSDYLRDHVRYTTQPIEEPERPEDLRWLFGAIGWDRLMFSTDYPHWDYDDPRRSIPIALSQDERRRLFFGNALDTYRNLDPQALTATDRTPAR